MYACVYTIHYPFNVMETRINLPPYLSEYYWLYLSSYTRFIESDFSLDRFQPVSLFDMCLIKAVSDPRLRKNQSGKQILAWIWQRKTQKDLYSENPLPVDRDLFEFDINMCDHSISEDEENSRQEQILSGVRKMIEIEEQMRIE